MFCFRVSEPTLFSFLNFALTRARACVYVHKPTRRRHQKIAKKDAVALFKPYKAATSHFMGAIDRFTSGTFSCHIGAFTGAGESEGMPPIPPQGIRGNGRVPILTRPI